MLAVPTYGLLHRLDGPYFAIGTWVVAEVMRLATSVFPYVNAGAGMSLRVMTDYSAYERAVGVSLLCALMLLVTIGGSYLAAALALRPGADRDARQSGRGGKPGRQCRPAAIPHLDRRGRRHRARRRDLLHGAAAHHAAFGLRPELGQHRDLHRHGRRARVASKAC